MLCSIQYLRNSESALSNHLHHEVKVRLEVSWLGSQAELAVQTGLVLEEIVRELCSLGGLEQGDHVGV